MGNGRPEAESDQSEPQTVQLEAVSPPVEGPSTEGGAATAAPQAIASSAAAVDTPPRFPTPASGVTDRPSVLARVNTVRVARQSFVEMQAPPSRVDRGLDIPRAAPLPRNEPDEPVAAVVSNAPAAENIQLLQAVTGDAALPLAEDEEGLTDETRPFLRRSGGVEELEVAVVVEEESPDEVDEPARDPRDEGPLPPITTSLLPGPPDTNVSPRSPIPTYFDPERSLLARAHEALRRREPADALRAIASHETLFEMSAFAEHREGLRILALAQIGRVDDARMAAREFEERHPESRYLETIRRAMTLI